MNVQVLHASHHQKRFSVTWKLQWESSMVSSLVYTNIKHSMGHKQILKQYGTLTFCDTDTLTGLFKWCPTESARVPIASYRISKFLCWKLTNEYYEFVYLNHKKVMFFQSAIFRTRMSPCIAYNFTRSIPYGNSMYKDVNGFASQNTNTRLDIRVWLPTLFPFKHSSFCKPINTNPYWKAYVPCFLITQKYDP